MHSAVKFHWSYKAPEQVSCEHLCWFDVELYRLSVLFGSKVNRDEGNNSLSRDEGAQSVVRED